MTRLRTLAALSFLAICPTIVGGQRPAPRRWLHQAYERRIHDVTTAAASETRMLLIAAVEGSTQGVVDTIEAAGGAVRFRHDAIGYVRAVVPKNRLERLSAAPVISIGVDFGTLASTPVDTIKPCTFEAASSDGISERPAPRAPTAPWTAQRWEQGAWREDPFNRPYHPLKDMGAADWRHGHPTYDGRGVVIAHHEAPLDLLAPELVAAKSLAGREITKVRDVFTTDNPAEEIDAVRARAVSFGAGVWVSMRDRIDTPTGTFAHGGEEYTASRRGRFRFGLFDVDTRICRTIEKRDPVLDWNRGGGRPNGTECRFGVLWDDSTGEVWLDADRDRTFGDERTMYDYAVRHDVGIVGQDDPRTRARESFSFTVQTRCARDHVAIVIGLGGHPNVVAASAAGSLGRHGHIEGIAPGAELLSVYSGLAARSMGQSLEGLIAAFYDRRVDVVLTENNSLFDAAGRRGDGEGVVNVIIQRLIEATGKPFVAPAGNMQKDGAIDGLAQVQWGFAAGASQGRDAWWTNYGVRVPHDQNLHSAGTYGPGDDGSVQPTVLAPTGWLAPERGRNDIRGYAVLQEGLYLLPPGYVMGGGTSQAAPTLAGALALLISAAKQAGIPYDAERLWRAITSSARFAPHIPAYKQGHGFLDVSAAFVLLKAYVERPPATTIESRGSVRTAWSGHFSTPHEGVGLYEREGWAVGMHDTRTIRLTRTSGPRAPMTFTLTWDGNDGTFTGPTSVTLPLNQPVAVPIAIAPKTPGFHSALLNISHASVPGYVHRVMTTVVAARRFTAEDRYTLSIRDSVERPTPMASYYMEIPGDAAALTVQAGGRDDELYWLWGPETTRHVGAFRSVAAVALPEPGVWAIGTVLDRSQRRLSNVDLRWLNPGTSVDPPANVDFTARLLGADVTLIAPRVDMSRGASASVDVEAANRFAPFVGGIVSSALASGRLQRGHLASTEQRMYEIDVPQGAELLEVALTNPEPGIVPALSLFDCTTSACAHVGTADGPTARRVLRQRQPRPGRWKVMVDLPAGPASGVHYEYREMILNPALGGVVSTDVSVERSVGARWRARAHVWRSEAPLPPGHDAYLAVIVAATLADGNKIPIAIATQLLDASSESR